jgi:hypothetical protein
MDWLPMVFYAVMTVAVASVAIAVWELTLKK